MKYFKKTDLLIIAVLVLISALSCGIYRGVSAGEEVKAEIYYRSELVRTVELIKGSEETFSIPEVPGVVFHRYADGTIAFLESDCPDQVCVHAGRIGTPGQFAACLPNSLVLRVVSAGEEGAADTVTGI